MSAWLLSTLLAAVGFADVDDEDDLPWWQVGLFLILMVALWGGIVYALVTAGVFDQLGRFTRALFDGLGAFVKLPFELAADIVKGIL